MPKELSLPWRKLHFIGIGGIGMSALANILLEEGYQISGSDVCFNPLIAKLQKKGAVIHLKHSAQNINGAQVVVYSSAIKGDNPEFKRAQEKGLKTISRGELLGLLSAHKKTIAIAGTHGKTTTSAMISVVLEEAGLSPTVLVGGCLKDRDQNAWGGQGDLLVTEADESDGSFLKLSPMLAVVTNCEPDHLDFYQTKEAMIGAYEAFIKKVKQKVVFCGDDSVLSSLVNRHHQSAMSYGFGERNHLRAKGLMESASQTQCEVWLANRLLGHLELKLPGRHNVLNALAAIGIGLELGIKFEIMAKALKAFQGVKRRQEIKGEKSKILVIDDYGHHPTEIRETLKALKTRWPQRRLITIFQPHRYTRTCHLYYDFLKAFDLTDELIITEIYPASELPLPGVTGKWLAEGLALKRRVYFCSDEKQVIKRLNTLLMPNDVLLTLGAGDVWKIGEKVLQELL